MRLNQDSIVAILLLVMCGVFIAATFTIRQTSYGTIGSELWPRIILAAMTVICLIYLVNSLRQGHALAPASEGVSQRSGLIRFFHDHLNAFICFAAFAVFVATLPYLGMLIGGVLFVFITLTLLGGWDRKGLIRHAAIALATVGFMWAVFTFGLHVFLPEGELLRIF